MKILINERLSKHRCKTPEGYLICTDAILARTGKQTYRKNEIFKDSDDETEIEVDRTEDEVFSPQTLASFENKPVTVEHPDEDVNVHNYKEYAVGFVRDVRRGDANGQPVILGNLVITDEQTIQEIENGEHTDLSCGYDCDIADEANPCQRNIRGNHVALCECGRAGIARIVDSTCDANRLPTKVKRDLQKFLNHKSTFISNKDYDISEFVKEFERVSRLWAEFPLKIVRESIKGWFETGDGMMRKDYAFSIEGYDDRFMVSLYAKPDTYETTELNAYFTDSVKDATYDIKAVKGHFEVYKDGKLFSTADTRKEAEDDIKADAKESETMKDAMMTILVDIWEDEQKTYKSKASAAGVKVGRSDGKRNQQGETVEDIYFSGDEANLNRFLRSINRRSTASEYVVDSIKDRLVEVPQNIIMSFERQLKYHHVGIAATGRTWSGLLHYQVEFDGSAKQLVDILDKLSASMHAMNIPMTYNAGDNGEGFATAGIDIDKQFVKDSVKDALIPTKESINKFESFLRILNVKIDKKGLTTFGRMHYQVRAIMPFDQFVKILHRIDGEMDKLGIPMTFNAGFDGNTCTAGIDLDKQYVNDSAKAQKILKIIKVVKSIK